MTTATPTRTYRCLLDGGPAHGLVLPAVPGPPPAVIDVERRDHPGWAWLYETTGVDDDAGVARYRFVTPTSSP